MRLAERQARLREQPGRLGRWCAGLERGCDDLRRAEAGSADLTRRLRSRLVRWFFESLVLAVIGVAELVGLWHQAGRALAVPPRRR
jgi:hypothetical protein